VGHYTVSLTVTNGFGSNTLTQESYIHAMAAVENIYICDGYDGAGPIFSSCVTELQTLGATESNGVWRYDNTTKGVTYLIHEVTTPAGMEAALKEEGAHVIYKGHANYGMGATFAWTDLEQSWIRYFDDDLIVNLSTDMADPDIPGLKYGQAYPNWEPILQDGTSPIMPYSFDDPDGPPPYNYYLTYTVPGDPTHYRIEKPDGSYWERFPDSNRPAWYSPDGTPPDPMLNPEYFITNDNPDFNRCEFIGEWPMDSPGDWHVSTTYVSYNYQYHTPGTGTNKAIWTLVVDEPGLYAVIATWHAAPTHATNAPYTIHHAYGTDTVRMDQRTTNYMNMLGVYYFEKGSCQVELSDDADGRVSADVVALSYIGNPASYLNAEFSSGSRGGSAPLVVNFRDYSTVYINGNFQPRYGWRWDFGDGTTSTQQNPSHTYAAPGAYTVSLTVIDELGNTDTEIKEQYITIDASPTLRAEFTSDGQTTVPNTLIGFIDQSTGDIQSRLWDFGDGTTSIEQNPYHAYAASGAYTVSLTVSGPDGSSTHTEENFICITVGLAAADNTFSMKPHFYTVYSGALMGRTVLDASEVTIPDEELRYSRLFYSSCTSGAYYLGKLHRGPTFYTTERTDGTNPIPGYLSRYLQGWTDEALANWVYSTNPIYEFYNFDLLPPSLR
jgi:PKD repeat protein